MTTLPTSKYARTDGDSKSYTYFANSIGLSRNLFQTSSTAVAPFMPRAIGSSRSRITRCERVHASRYEVVASTTAGTSRTVSAPQSAAFRIDVSIPWTLRDTTGGSLLDGGSRQ